MVSQHQSTNFLITPRIYIKNLVFVWFIQYWLTTITGIVCLKLQPYITLTSAAICILYTNLFTTSIENVAGSCYKYTSKEKYRNIDYNFHVALYLFLHPIWNTCMNPILLSLGEKILFIKKKKNFSGICNFARQ